MRKSKTSNSYYLYAGAVIVVIVLIIFAASQKSGPSIYNEFAQCLSDQGVILYGAWWCPHCINQKELFGTAIENLNYVECSAPGSRSMNTECNDAGIEGYPTWIDGSGNKFSGERTIEELAEISGCELPTE